MSSNTNPDGRSVFLLILFYGTIALTSPVRQMPFVLAMTLVLAGLLIWLSVVDFCRFEIPDSATLAIAGLGILAILSLVPAQVVFHLFAAALGFLLFWGIGELIFRVTRQEGLGIGDAKLFGAAAIWVGWAGLPSLVLIASLTGIFFAILKRIRQSGEYDRRIPFGPFLSLALFLVWLYGPIQIW